MFRFLALLLMTSLVFVGCGRGGDAVAPATDSANAQDSGISSLHDDLRSGCYLNWGEYKLEIARDGSYGFVTPSRSAMESHWGVHLNAVKLLEVHPCTDCIELSNIHVLHNGDVSVDVTLRHPWPAYPPVNKFCTGFDVRGIILFPSSQYTPDPELRKQAGQAPLPPDYWLHRFSSHEKGDAELMNPDGWTRIWAPDLDDYNTVVDEGLPIFQYYEGKWAAGENLGTINAFKYYWTNENRHMFEVGRSATRTYVIRPPDEGPIQASYIVYAHWALPTRQPVVDPATDFPVEANSPMPYEFWITQDAPVDFDDPDEEQGLPLRWHVKTWPPFEDYNRLWFFSIANLIMPGIQTGIHIEPHPNGGEDDYFADAFGPDCYKRIPDALPGEWTYIFRVCVKHPTYPDYGRAVGEQFYITKIYIDSYEGG